MSDLKEKCETELGMQRALIEKMQETPNFDEAEVSVVHESSEESVQEANDILKRVVQQ